MDQLKFIMLCGLPASGKSTKAQELAKLHKATIFSSDDLRKKMFNDVNDQTHNQELFTELHKRIKDCLRSGKSAIYDACNISYKRRMAFLTELKNIPCKKVCVLVATPYKECLKRNSERVREVPQGVIERMYRNFDVPWYYEGWDSIEVHFNVYRATYGAPYNWIQTVKKYNQQNSHHILSLGEHCWQVYKKIKEIHCTNKHNDVVMRISGMLHDCGKKFCQTFMNTKGDITDEAHYYAHEHTGSYDSLFFGMDCNQLAVAIRIRWHMQPYFWEKDGNEKLHNKYKKLWGEDLYNDIITLHKADLAAH